MNEDNQEVEGELLNASPLPAQQPVFQMDFYEALRKVMNGKKITRIEWHDPNIYGFLKEGILTIHLLKDTEWKDEFWALCDGDIEATDWVFVEGIQA